MTNEIFQRYFFFVQNVIKEIKRRKKGEFSGRENIFIIDIFGLIFQLFWLHICMTPLKLFTIIYHWYCFFLEIQLIGFVPGNRNSSTCRSIFVSLVSEFNNINCNFDTEHNLFLKTSDLVKSIMGSTLNLKTSVRFEASYHNFIWKNMSSIWKRKDLKTTQENIKNMEQNFSFLFFVFILYFILCVGKGYILQFSM